MFIEVFLFVCLAVLYKLWLSNKPPEEFPPGPIGIPILGYLPFLGTDLAIGLSKLTKKYGKVYSVRLGSFRCVVLNDQEIIRQAFKTDECSGRPDLYIFTGRSEGKNGIISNDGASLLEQRRFTLQHLRDFGFGKKILEGVIHEETEELLSRFRKANGKKVDINMWFNMATVNILWQIVAGERYSHDDPRLTEIVKKTNQFVGNNLTFMAITLLPLLQKFPRFSGFSGFLELVKSWNAFFQVVIDQHKSTYTENDMRDFTDVYLRQIKATTDTNSSFYKEAGEKSLRIGLQDLFSAGSETTSTTLTWAVLIFMLHPEVQKKCQREIDQVVGRDKLPRLEDRNKMPFIQATIAEIMRIAPVIHLGLFHNTTQKTEIAGFKIPKDTVLVSNIYHVHYDTKIWGDPEKFRPERFINTDGQFVNHEAVIPFSVGKRACLGEPLARNEVFLLLTGILQSVSFSVPDGEVPPTLEPNPGIVRQPKPYLVTVNVRD